MPGDMWKYRHPALATVAIGQIDMFTDMWPSIRFSSCSSPQRAVL